MYLQCGGIRHFNRVINRCKLGKGKKSWEKIEVYLYILVDLCSCLYRTLYSYLHKHHLKRMLQLDMWSLCPSSGPTIILQLEASKMQADLDLDPHTIRVPSRGNDTGAYPIRVPTTFMQSLWGFSPIYSIQSPL